MIVYLIKFIHIITWNKKKRSKSVYKIVFDFDWIWPNLFK